MPGTGKIIDSGACSFITQGAGVAQALPLDLSSGLPDIVTSNPIRGVNEGHQGLTLSFSAYITDGVGTPTIRAIAYGLPDLDLVPKEGTGLTAVQQRLPLLGAPLSRGPGSSPDLLIDTVMVAGSNIMAGNFSWSLDNDAGASHALPSFIALRLVQQVGAFTGGTLQWVRFRVSA